MRAVRYDRFGGPSVMRVVEVSSRKPKLGELRVRVHAAAVNPKDILVRKGKMRWASGWGFPRGTGYDWAGEVVELGPESFAKVGDPLFGMMNGFAGGAVAEEIVVRFTECAPMPNVSFEHAASLPLAALTALQALRDVGRVRPGQRVALLGASGGVGVHAIQIARALGAEVTATSSAANHTLLAELGAHHTLDYHHDDALDHGPFDCIFDCFGSRNFVEAERALASVGTYITTVPSLRAATDFLTTMRDERKARFVMVKSRRGDLITLARMVDEGMLRPVVDSVFALDDIAAAHTRVESKRSRGKVVVQLSPA